MLRSRRPVHFSDRSRLPRLPIRPRLGTCTLTRISCDQLRATDLAQNQYHLYTDILLRAIHVAMTHITTKDGTRIFYKDWGPREAQPIAFHHGWPLSFDDWDNQMNVFPRGGLSRHGPTT